MQILDVPTILEDKGHYIETFLISTKGNDAKWRIDKATGHEKVKTFDNRDFAIIPELIFRPLEQGGGGHVFGTRDYVLKKYADNSHGKITGLKGPYYYNDGTDDYYYNALIHLNDSRAASALIEHGNNTWVPFAVSPHIFINEDGGGDDDVGWKDWSGAALVLVIKGAYGNEAVVSKLCNGPHKACKMELMQRSAGIDSFDPSRDTTTANLITSLVSKTASSNSNIPMVDNKLSTEQPEPEKPNNGEEPEGGGGEGNQQQTMKVFKDTEVIKPTNEQINISADELNQLRETQKQFKEMQNERRDELLNSMFSTVEDEKQRSELIKEYSKNDLQAVKNLKSFYDKVSPLISNATKKAIEMELQKQKDEDNKKTKVNSNGRSASVVTLRPEPKVEEQKTASTTQIDEVGMLKRFLNSKGGNII